MFDESSYRELKLVLRAAAEVKGSLRVRPFSDQEI